MNRACWAVTSATTFREVYKAHKYALETKAIRLDDQEEGNEGNSEESGLIDNA
jgi:hypothetical protein